MVASKKTYLLCCMFQVQLSTEDLLWETVVLSYLSCTCTVKSHLVPEMSLSRQEGGSKGMCDRAQERKAYQTFYRTARLGTFHKHYCLLCKNKRKISIKQDTLLNSCFKFSRFAVLAQMYYKLKISQGISSTPCYLV